MTRTVVLPLLALLALAGATNARGGGDLRGGAADGPPGGAPHGNLHGAHLGAPHSADLGALRESLHGILLGAIPGALPGAHPGTLPGTRFGTRPGARPLPFYYDLYSFRAEGGRTSVVASFAVRVGDLARERVSGAYRYRFNVTLVVADTAEQRVYRADDSVYVRVRDRLSGDHLLFTQLETTAPPSTATLQRVVMIDAPQPGIGQLYTDPWPVPDYTGDELMLSDIAPGLPGVDGGWTRGGERLALLPSNNFPGGPFELYYEIYNLPDGNSYVTNITIEPLTGGGAGTPDEDAAVHVRFQGEAEVGPDGMLAERRQLFAPLPPGPNRLTVTVTDESTGLSASRTRLLEVRDWSAGATLVATCPVWAGAVRAGCH